MHVARAFYAIEAGIIPPSRAAGALLLALLAIVGCRKLLS
jgi:hypothetical protein